MTALDIQTKVDMAFDGLIARIPLSGIDAVLLEAKKDFDSAFAVTLSTLQAALVPAQVVSLVDGVFNDVKSKVSGPWALLVGVVQKGVISELTTLLGA